jgi:hypothetical protein
MFAIAFGHIESTKSKVQADRQKQIIWYRKPMFSIHNNPRAVARVGVREAVADCFEARIEEARIDARMEEARIEARIEADPSYAAEFHHTEPRREADASPCHSGSYGS